MTTSSATVPSQLPHFGSTPIDEGRQPHVPVAAQRDDGADHRQPQEQKCGEFVGPDDRAVEDIARHDAGKEDAGLDQNQQGADELGGASDQHVEGKGGAAQRRARKCRSRRLRCGRFAHALRTCRCDQASGPTYFSSKAQASSPIFFFTSG